MHAYIPAQDANDVAGDLRIQGCIFAELRVDVSLQA